MGARGGFGGEGDVPHLEVGGGIFLDMRGQDPILLNGKVLDI